MSVLSKIACQLSVRKLAVVSGATETYLHTLTFPDPEPSQAEAQERFDSLWRGYFDRLSPKPAFVWSIQRGGRTDRLHFHLVTCQRLDAAEMWQVLPRYGFGRYDVQKPRPVCFADYVAKYVSRTRGMDPHSKRWGCRGFSGVRVKDVMVETFELPFVIPLPSWLLLQLQRIDYFGDNFARRKNSVVKRFAAKLVLKMSNVLKAHQEKEVVAESQSGTYPIAVGEYRGSTLKSSKSVDRLSKVEINRQFVEHVVLCGTESIRVVEFLPPGAAVESVTPPAQVGEMVVVRFGEWKRNAQGLIQARGFIKALLDMPLGASSKATSSKS